MKVFLSELAETKLLKLSEYLLENWNLKTRDEFISKLTEKIKQISIQPDSSPKSSEFDQNRTPSTPQKAGGPEPLPKW